MSRERNMFWADQNNISIFFMLNKYVASVFFDVKGPRSLFSCYLTIPKKDEPFKHQSQRLIRYTQTTCSLLSTNRLSVLEHFVRLVLKGV